MLRIILVLLICPVLAFGQNITPQGATNQVNFQRGGNGADSAMAIPVFADTAKANTFLAYRKEGRIVYTRTPQAFWYNTGFKWSQTSTGAGYIPYSDTLSRLIVTKTYADSLYNSIPAAQNFANTDLTFTGPRTHDVAGNSLTITNSTANVFQATDGSTTSYMGNTPGYAQLWHIGSDNSSQVNIGADKAELLVADKLNPSNGSYLTVRRDSVLITSPKLKTTGVAGYTTDQSANYTDLSWVTKGDVFNSSLYVNIEDCGGTGLDTTDDTKALDSAVFIARLQNKGIWIPYGKTFRVRIDSTRNMLGSSGFNGGGEIKATYVTTGTPSFFRWNGSVQLIASNIAVTSGTNSITLPLGLNLLPGDIIFLISTENIGNYFRNGNKGQRMTVSNYNKTSGLTNFDSYFSFSITSGYFYKNTVVPNVSINNITLSAPDSSNLVGLWVQYGKAQIKNVTLKNIGYVGVEIASSQAVLDNIQTFGTYYLNSTTSYGIQIADLSYALCYNLNLNDGRHSFQQGGVGTWNNNQAGGVDSQMFLPAVAYIYNSTFSPNSNVIESEGALDQHGIGGVLEVYNSTIYDGVVAGGLRFKAENCNIYGFAEYPIVLGRDRIDPSVGSGSYQFVNNNIYSNKSLILLSGSLRNLVMSGNRFYSSIPTTGSLEMIVTNTYVFDTIRFDGYKHFGNTGERTTYTLPIKSSSRFENIELLNSQLTVVSNTTGLDLSIKNLTVRNAFNSGLTVAGSITANKPNNVLLDGIYISGCRLDGIQYLGSTNLTLINSRLNDNGTALTSDAYGIRVRETNYMFASNNDFRSSLGTQTWGIFKQAPTSGVNTHALFNNDFRGNITGSASLTSSTSLGAWGNIADASMTVLSRNDLGSDATGDIYYRNSTGNFTRLADVATGNALISGGVGAIPSYGKISLTTHVSNTLPVANGGTGLATLGTANQQLRVNSGATALEYFTSPIVTGSGSPNGVVTANPGTLYLNSAGGAGTTLYVKESGTGNTGWVGK